MFESLKNRKMAENLLDTLRSQALYGRDDLSEARRLNSLRATGLLDSPREPEFDELVEIAAAVCGASMSLVSLVDEKRQWFKASVGMPQTETSREVSFCSYAILQPDIFTVEDASSDPRFRDNPLVTADHGLRFYAGVPVQSPDGLPLGTLCVLDTVPRQMNEAQLTALRTLGRQVNARIELRTQRLELERALAAAEEAKAQLANTERRFTTFMDSGPFLGFLKDAEGRFVFYNQMFAKRFNISLTDWLGKSVEDLFPAEFAESYTANDREVLHSMKTVDAIEETQNSDGTRTTWRSFKFPCLEADGSYVIGGISLDVSKELTRENELLSSKKDLEDANALLHTLAATDALTNLANRRIFDERLDLEFARSRRKKLALAVLMIDVDNFKRRNDTYGHDSGDQVLRQLADVLRKTVRESDLAARYGGEEFIVLLPEADEVQALGMSERILAAIRAEQWPNEPVELSIGAAGLEQATPNAQRLVTLADEALYVAKRAGKNRAVGYRAYYREMVAQLELAADKN